MRLTLFFLVFVFIFSSCQNPVKKEMRPLVEEINTIVRHIDANHRVGIIENDYQSGDSLIRIRGYSMDNQVLKLVAVTHTTEYERDDYFYFDKGHVIFSGHMVNHSDELIAEEYKYYYEKDKIVESLFWKDHYERGKQFPHEKFKEFDPNMDSLLPMERSRITSILDKLAVEGVVVKHLNENLEANIVR